MFGITDIYVRWSKACLYLCSIFVVLLMLSFSSKAFAATTEIRAIIEPVRYVYLNRDNNIRSILSNTSSSKNIAIYWLDYRNNLVNPSIKELNQYNYLISKINLQKTGSIYSLESPKKLKSNNIFSALISRISIIRPNPIF